MKKLLLWSGGYDSTAMLLKECFEVGGKEFDTCYCLLPNNKETQDHELMARKKIMSKITSWYLKDRPTKDMIFELVQCLNKQHNPQSLLSQPFVWATTLMWNLDISKYDEVVMGYIKYDDFWHIKSEFEQFILTGLQMLHTRPIDIKFTYPFEWHDKPTIHRDVYDHHNLSQMVHDVVVCECPRGCNKLCASSKRHIAEFGYLVNSGINFRNM